MRINHNIAALNTYRQLSGNNTVQQKSLAKLSSGLRINSAADDAAGLAISEKMRGQIRGLEQASRNSQDAISLIQTAEGALNETHSILQRMRELANQAASDTNVEVDRGEIQKEINQLTSEINRIGNTTEFNTMKLVNGDRAITLDESSVDKTVVVSKNYTITASPGISSTGTGEFPTFINGENANQIKIEASDDFDWASLKTDGTNTITITKSGENLKVEIAATDGTNSLSVTDEFATLKDGFYEYNAHGVSFKISEADFDAMFEADAVKIDLSAVAKAAGDTNTNVIGTVGTKSSWTTNSNGTGLSDADIADGIKIDASQLMEGAKSLKLAFNGTDYTLTIFDSEDGTGKALSTDVITQGTPGAWTYNNHGVSFTLTQSDAASLELKLNFDTETVTETTTTVVEDKSLFFQVGANENQAMALDINDMRSVALGISSATSGAGFAASQAVTDGTNNTAVEYALDVSNHKAAAASVTIINNAIETVSAERSKLGAYQNRLEHTINNLGTSAENLTAAESRIRDVDYAAAA